MSDRVEIFWTGDFHALRVKVMCVLKWVGELRKIVFAVCDMGTGYTVKTARIRVRRDDPACVGGFYSLGYPVVEFALSLSPTSSHATPSLPRHFVWFPTMTNVVLAGEC
jgi:hypothetical protein